MLKLFHRFNSRDFYKYTVTILLIVIPLYPKFPLFSVPGTYVSIRMEDLLIGVSFLLFLPLILKELKNLLKNKIIRSIMLFLFIGLVSLISAVFVTKTVLPHIGLLHLVRRIEYLSLFVLGYLYIKNFYRSSRPSSAYKKGDIEYFIKVLGLIIGFAFIYGLLQRYFSFPVIITQNSEYSKGIALRWIPGSHINSTFAGHYDLASYLVLILPIFTTGFFVLKDKFSKIFFSVVSLMGYWLLSSAVSRISIVSFLVAGTVSLLALKKYKSILVFGLISLILFGFSPSLRARYMRIFGVVKEKIVVVNTVYAQGGEVFEDRSTSIRLNVEWPRAIRAWRKNPLLGTGYSSITLATDNDYLRALGEVGMLGFSAFLLIFINIGRVFAKNLSLKNMERYEKIFFVSLVGGMLGILVNAFFIDIFEASKLATSYWLLMGILIGEVKSKQ